MKKLSKGSIKKGISQMREGNTELLRMYNNQNRRVLLRYYKDSDLYGLTYYIGGKRKSTRFLNDKDFMISTYKEVVKDLEKNLPIEHFKNICRFPLSRSLYEK